LPLDVTIRADINPPEGDMETAILASPFAPFEPGLFRAIVARTLAP
jgi:hypothetical protein